MAAKDGTNRGGARPGAGRKPKPLAEKIMEGKKGKVIPAPPDLETPDMPDVKEYLSDDQRMGDFYAKEIYEETWRWLKDRHCDENVIRSLATVIQTSGERKINVAASKPAASWVEENGELTFGDATFDQTIVDAFKVSVAVKVSEELLADNAYDLESFLINAFGKAIGNAEEQAFIIGDGNAKPTGLLHPTKGGQIGVVTAGNTITTDEIVDLVYKLQRPYRANAVFLTSDSTLAAIRKLKDTTGQYLWQPALTAGEPDRLLGYPVYTSAYVPTIAAGQPVIQAPQSVQSIPEA